jgi:hypothetical protein
MAAPIRQALVEELELEETTGCATGCPIFAQECAFVNGFSPIKIELRN